MRHRNVGRRFGLLSGRRRALFRNLASSLILHEVIQTTVPKAKELRGYLEPLITRAKVDSVANRRLAFARLRDKTAVKKLFDVVGPKSKTRAGGYLRILRSTTREGDSAQMAYIEWVDRQS